jgi:hypothetical protein
MQNNGRRRKPPAGTFWPGYKQNNVVADVKVPHF